MRKNLMLATIFSLIGALSVLTNYWLDSYVDAQGFLHEYFGLIPTGYLLIIVGLGIGLFRFFSTKSL